MVVWIKSVVDVLIIDDISHWGFEIVSSEGDWYDATVPRWYFKGDFTTVIFMLLFTIPSVS